MSRDFSNSTANYMTLGVNKVGPLLGSVGGVTIAFSMWKDTSAAGNFGNPLFFYNSNSAAIFHWNSGLGGGSTLWYGARVTGDAYSRSISSQDTTLTAWGHNAFRLDWSANPYSFNRYKNGSSVASGTSAATGGNYVHTTATLADNIGSYSNAASGVPATTQRTIDGGLGEVAVWKKALTDGDLVALSSGACPLKVQPQFLVAYWRLNGQGSPEIDIISGLSATITGTVAVRDHPPVR